MGCSHLFPGCEADACFDDSAVYRALGKNRVAYLERQVAPFPGDLCQAEAAMVAIELGMREMNTRADAVSALAEARIAGIGLMLGGLDVQSTHWYRTPVERTWDLYRDQRDAFSAPRPQEEDGLSWSLSPAMMREDGYPGGQF